MLLVYGYYCWFSSTLLCEFGFMIVVGFMMLGLVVYFVMVVSCVVLGFV